jgi:hypothetical protein
VFLTVRRYWGFAEAQSLTGAHAEMMEQAEEWSASRVAPLIVNPLAQAIASRP